MLESKEQLRQFSERRTLVGLPSHEALNLLGQAIDLATDLNDPESAETVAKLGEELLSQTWPPTHQALLHYFLSNAWASIRAMRRTSSSEQWSWQQEESDRQILHLRKAISHPDFKNLDAIYQGRILTNLGNALSQIGRFVEAIEKYDEALEASPEFGMALGNKGMALVRFAVAHYDHGHQCILVAHAGQLLERALQKDLEGAAAAGFKKHLEYARGAVRNPERHVELSQKPHSLGRSGKEVKYRRWCLRKRLFLNPLNDLGSLEIASHDPLSLPTLTTPLNTGPKYLGLFNQLKQEFVSARFFLYESITPEKASFSDHATNLIDTLDYSTYGLGVEKAKIALRMSYSLLDKIAFFINDYFNLNVPPENVTFSSIWYQNRKYKDGLLPALRSRANWPLRGLYSLSRDIFDPSIGVLQGVEPDAKEIKDLRHALEHRYVKVLMHEPRPPDKEGHMFDSLAHRVSRARLDGLALRAVLCARAALIYLSFGVQSHEIDQKKKAPAGLAMPITFPTFGDRFKT